MDPRIREHARIVVDHCLDVQPGDRVLVDAKPAVEEFVVALYEELGARDAIPMRIGASPRASRAYLREFDPEAAALKEHKLAALEAADKLVMAWGMENTRETVDVPEEVSNALGEVNQPLMEEHLDMPWVGTMHPLPGNAQEAEMSTDAYEAFVYDAIDKDWEAQREFQQQMVEILEPADEVRIVSGDRTDIRMSVAGMDAGNDHAKRNLPGGEAYTVPVPDSVEGEVLFDLPVVTRGEELENVWLRFEDGAVIEFEADSGEEALGSILDRDDGSDRLGELGIGMNRDIDRLTNHMLFDEKMGDTVHLALGRCLDEVVPEGMSGNESSLHVDLLVDMSEDSFIEVDGEVVQRDGTFRFE
ncbi:aminopeptidase [Haloarchaeobius iranensis]|uniref:Aminopeptidase n=1 Tax=Haloarchaeobius iranensis TaxID=996166 RepID=A0A1H0AGT1_9EURY|nr:aminopeptidase [Haloarchaeobius iranensis]SDN32808.1 aminopeptidase [Haloarchaeobius iranensis]